MNKACRSMLARGCLDLQLDVKLKVMSVRRLLTCNIMRSTWAS